MKHSDRIGKLEQATGTGGEQKQRKVRIRGARDLLWEYAIAEVDGVAKVVDERVVLPEEEAQRRGTPEAEARGRARSSLRYYAEWAGKFPDEYPRLSDQLDYARQHATPGDDEGQLYDDVCRELLAEVT
ncbi:unnamed protein product [marine sediment metagenome]|uniref:Uncharacterized protein n=1 Tax=marine sediment metagenome TaxID=412755 RepID=X0VFX6_9ZZZZ